MNPWGEARGSGKDPRVGTTRKSADTGELPALENVQRSFRRFKGAKGAMCKPGEDGCVAKSIPWPFQRPPWGSQLLGICSNFTSGRTEHGDIDSVQGLPLVVVCCFCVNPGYQVHWSRAIPVEPVVGAHSPRGEVPAQYGFSFSF